MSALGQKQTYAAQQVMSALPPIATVKSGHQQEVMSALPPKADMCGAVDDVRYGPKADICSRDDHIDALEKSVRDTHAYGLRRLEINSQFELGGLLNR